MGMVFSFIICPIQLYAKVVLETVFLEDKICCWSIKTEKERPTLELNLVRLVVAAVLATFPNG